MCWITRLQIEAGATVMGFFSFGKGRAKAIQHFTGCCCGRSRHVGFFLELPHPWGVGSGRSCFHVNIVGGGRGEAAPVPQQPTRASGKVRGRQRRPGVLPGPDPVPWLASVQLRSSRSPPAITRHVNWDSRYD